MRGCWVGILLGLAGFVMPSKIPYNLITVYRFG